MASSIIHLAVTAELAREFPFRDPDRLLLGSVLPDGTWDRNRSHLRIDFDGGTRKTYDAEGFRERFGDLMATDDLYLGYYLHLIQDILFRHFMYRDHRFDSRAPGYVQHLHLDYAVTNPAVIRRHGLTAEMVKVLDPGPRLSELGTFDVPGFVTTVRSYFVPVERTECSFFTVPMAYDCTDRALDLSRKELAALRSGGPLLDSRAWGWENRG